MWIYEDFVSVKPVSPLHKEVHSALNIFFSLSLSLFFFPFFEKKLILYISTPLLETQILLPILVQAYSLGCAFCNSCGPDIISPPSFMQVPLGSFSSINFISTLPPKKNFVDGHRVKSTSIWVMLNLRFCPRTVYLVKIKKILLKI